MWRLRWHFLILMDTFAICGELFHWTLIFFLPLAVMFTLLLLWISGRARKRLAESAHERCEDGQPPLGEESFPDYWVRQRHNSCGIGLFGAASLRSGYGCLCLGRPGRNQGDQGYTDDDQDNAACDEVDALSCIMDRLPSHHSGVSKIRPCSEGDQAAIR